MVEFITAGFYGVALLMRLLHFARSKWLAVGLGLAAVGLHGVLLHRWIDVGGVQNLGFSNMFSLMAWLVALIVLLVSLRYPIGKLLLFAFPVAMISIGLVKFFPGQYMVNAGTDIKGLVHILLGVLTVSVFCVAGLQALWLAFQERRLRRHILAGQVPASPLETTEKLLFQMVWVGFILLSLMLFSSVYFFAHGLLMSAVLHKTILGAIAWGVFAVLLWGRYYHGWRGHRAVYYTIVGVVLIVVTYLVSNLGSIQSYG